jgi:hypothetical protein
VRAADAGGREEGNGVDMGAGPVDLRPPVSDARLIDVSGCQVTVGSSASDDCSGVVLHELHRGSTAGFVPSPATLLATAPAAPVVDTVPGDVFFYYKAVAADASGRRQVSAPAEARVDACVGTPLPPGEARQLRAARDGTGGLTLSFTAAAGADAHRVVVGSLPVLRTGAFDHVASVGPDRLHGTGDDVGSCAASAPARVPEPAGASYFLVLGVNAVGEGIAGRDGAGQAYPAGSRDCP